SGRFRGGAHAQGGGEDEGGGGAAGDGEDGVAGGGHDDAAGQAAGGAGEGDGDVDAALDAGTVGEAHGVGDQRRASQQAEVPAEPEQAQRHGQPRHRVGRRDGRDDPGREQRDRGGSGDRPAAVAVGQAPR